MSIKFIWARLVPVGVIMKKNFLRIFLAAAIAVLAIISLASCDMLPAELQDMLGLGGECQHTEVEWVTDMAATCKFEGKNHSVCSKCGEIVEYGVIEKSDHTPGEWETEIEATCNRVGSHFKKCTVCKTKVVTEDIPISTVHDYFYGTCNVCKVAQPASEGLKFTSNGDGTCTLAGIGSCTDTSLVIPTTSPAGDKVTSIASEAFKDVAQIKTVIIPESVTSAGADAFKGSSVERATVPVVVVPAFRSTGIQELTVTGKGRIADNAMQGAAKLRVLKMAEGITEIGENAFSGTALVSIQMPDSLTLIGTGAFANCARLNTLNIGNGVVEIGQRAFYNCDYLYTVYVPASVIKIGLNAFYRSPRIEDAYFEVTEGWSQKGVAKTPEDMSNSVKAGNILQATDGGELIRSVN